MYEGRGIKVIAFPVIVNQPEENTMVNLSDNGGCEFECHVGDRLLAEITAVLDENGDPTKLPAIPAWGSNDLSVAVPDQASQVSGGKAIMIDAVGNGACDIYVDIISEGKIVRGICHLTVKPKAGPVRTVTISLEIA